MSKDLEELEVPSAIKKRVGNDCRFFNGVAEHAHLCRTLKGSSGDASEHIRALLRSLNTKVMSNKIPSIPAIGEELATIIIQALDTSHDLGINIGECVEKKMLYNWMQPRKQGKES